MTRRQRRNHTASFKAKVALAALRGDKIGELTMVNDFLSKALRRDH